MDSNEQQFLQDLVRRHAAGERGAPFLALLNLAAGAYLDALRPEQVLTQGRLPLEESPPFPGAVRGTTGRQALSDLGQAIEAMGMRAFRDSEGLRSCLPYDPLADVMAVLQCRMDAVLAGFHVSVSPDRTWPREQGEVLRKRGAAWEGGKRCLRHLAWQPWEGARIRPRLVGWIPFGAAGSYSAHLVRIVDEVERYYRALGEPA